ncbi:MAG: DUF2723 domain-containing protein [Bacteroidota bacterium]|nr:DUF2723 domain-containing protein [Bacteroidota bacterium]MDX5428233.1 DUF2723 domain-containing protein [Bacteroidota bacterium]MDX5447300.1 DUF2723 domain-containing protein [Bacteroidota bacterium]MDX5506014.1 DUF2723 domain-containing protein [Bacteroidota bacterium]
MVQNFNKINNWLGWAIFAIASFVYVSTIEPTASFWDCGEYIATSVKLQVGHPPGAPFFQLIGNAMSRFAFGDVTKQAMMVNLVSAFSSSFTILFLFWTITHMGRKLSMRFGEFNQARMIAVLGSGAVGALAYTFSDSFWFSAVEGEVYAMSSFFTAMAFWMILKWEEAVDSDVYANRWLILIAFIVGLSVGVHILVFLTIPAMSMIYYFKKFPNHTTRGFVIANLVSLAVLGIVFKGIIPLVLNILGKTEIIFVNSFNLPFNSGTVFALLVLTGLAVWGLKYTRKNNKPLINQAILAVIFLMIGYSSFLVLAIRSNANTPIDENNPEDALSLLDYYNRVQYGDWPVLYGRFFNATYDRNEPFKDGSPTYMKGFSVLDGEREVQQFRQKAEAEKFVANSGKTYSIDARYIMTDDKKESVPNYDKEYTGFFPRMWSDDPGHVQNYVKIAGLRNENEKPTFGDNLRFFFNYQLGYMYFRYFMWNFAGRQNDEQGHMELTKGNWISGIPFVDSIRLGPQDNLPSEIKDNPAHNKYFLLPFILGLVGLYFQFKNDWRDAWATLLFFLFTGVAVVIYTNHKPFEPRERDYAFVGSFYVYAIWIGLGVLAIFELLKESMKKSSTAWLVGGLCLLLVPGIMAKENWDDHDRSNRYTARDIARAYLDSCEPNSILFTNGDNDTFPLWYVQEVEGYRTDVRVVNLSLLNTDWYIDQMRRAAYEGAPVPFSFDWNQYKQGTRDVIYFRDIGVKGRWMIDDFIKFVKSDDPKTRFLAMGSKSLQFYPVKKLRVPVDKEAVLRNNVVSPKDTSRILPYIDWDLGSNILSKRDIMVVDLIANNNWERPIYFSITVGNSSKSYFWLEKYFRLEGMAYRFVPYENTSPNRGLDFGEIDTDRMYDNLMTKFEFGNMEDPNVYLDETNRRLSFNLRNIYGRLAMELAKEGKNEKAIEVADLAMEKMPIEKFGFNYFVFGLIEAYYRAGANDKGHDLVMAYADRLDEELLYYNQFKGTKRKLVEQDAQNAAQYYQMLIQLYQQFEVKDFSNEGVQKNPLYERFMNLSKR